MNRSSPVICIQKNQIGVSHGNQNKHNYRLRAAGKTTARAFRVMSSVIVGTGVWRCAGLHDLFGGTMKDKLKELKEMFDRLEIKYDKKADEMLKTEPPDPKSYAIYAGFAAGMRLSSREVNKIITGEK